jgi:hypothetical protein
MLNSRIVEFRRLARTPEPRPVKAVLRPDVALSVQRSLGKLPVLGQRFPDAALVIERSIDDYMPPPNDDGEHKHLGNPAEDEIRYPIITNTPRRQAARVRLRRMRQAARLRQRQIGEELKRNTHRDVMAMLRDMAGSAA